MTPGNRVPVVGFQTGKDGRLAATTPSDACNRTPSDLLAKDGKGFKALGDQLHGMGLKFGMTSCAQFPCQAVQWRRPSRASTSRPRRLRHLRERCSGSYRTRLDGFYYEQHITHQNGGLPDSIQNRAKSIQTNQQLSPRRQAPPSGAGSAHRVETLRRRFRTRCQRPTIICCRWTRRWLSCTGWPADARKLTHVSVPALRSTRRPSSAIKRVASQSESLAILPRLPVGRGASFWPLCGVGTEPLAQSQGRLGLDLDSTRLLHEDGQQEGVAVGYTKRGLKPCLHPLLAVLAEVRLVVQLWLRPGNAACGNNVVAFFLELWNQLPRHIRLRGVRADAGFCLPDLLALWEQLGCPTWWWRN